MSKSNDFENDLLRLVFNAIAIANLADNAASAPLTQLFVSLHTADPGEVGTQATSEIGYTGYSRVGVNRNTGGWTVTANSVSPVAAIAFGLMTAGAGGTVSHFSIGFAASGATKVMFKGAVAPTILVANGVTPSLGTGTVITED